MRTRTVGGWVVAVAMLVGLPGGAWAADGKAVFAKKCASCHGDKGEGKPAIAKMMKVEMRHLGAPEVQSKSDTVLVKNVTEGVDKMKPVKGMSEDEVKAVVAYVRTLKP
jgi:cytochrome c